MVEEGVHIGKKSGQQYEIKIVGKVDLPDLSQVEGYMKIDFKTGEIYTLKALGLTKEEKEKRKKEREKKLAERKKNRKEEKARIRKEKAKIREEFRKKLAQVK